MKHITIPRILLPAIAAVIAMAPASPLRAQAPAISYDFNGDGFLDMAVITSPTTITVSLGSLWGYTVSDILTTSKNYQISYLDAYDRDGDGILDIYATSPAGSTSWYTHTWLGNGDGTFGNVTTRKYSWPKGPRGFF
jgi:hypothetical protein